MYLLMGTLKTLTSDLPKELVLTQEREVGTAVSIGAIKSSISKACVFMHSQAFLLKTFQKKLEDVKESLLPSESVQKQTRKSG